MTITTVPDSAPDTALPVTPGSGVDLTPLTRRVTPLLPALQALEANLAARFIERQGAIRAILVALLARQHAVLIGPPGAAKSDLIASLARCIGGPGAAGLTVFSQLVTRFTTPDELFGPVSVQGLKTDRYRRLTTGRVPEAEIVFADEIFKASSAILNSLLTIMQERLYDNDGQRAPVPLLSLYGASNELPQGEDLHALWDRFSLRVIVDYTSDAGFNRLLALVGQRRQERLATLLTPPGASGNGANGGVPSTSVAATSPTLDRPDLALLQAAVAALPLPGSLTAALEQVRKDLLAKGITVSDRRFGWAPDLLTAHALLEGRLAAEEDDLLVLADAFWQLPDQRTEIRRLVARLANPLNARATELGDQAASVRDAALATQRDGGLDEQAKMQAAIEAATKLKAIAGQLGQVREQAQAQGRAIARIERAAGHVREMQQEITALIL